MHPDSKKYTAFSIPDGHFHYNRMPWTQKCTRNISTNDQSSTRWIDRKTVLCLSRRYNYFQKYHTRTQSKAIIFLPFALTHERNWTKITTKREYLKPELEYLRHLITKDGVKPNPNKIKTIKDFRIPGNPTEVKSFLGLTDYYRKFIGNFSKIAKPLTNLTKEGTPYH